MGNGFHLIPAHSVATLAEALAAQLTHRGNPLAPETVLVMNYAQRVWLRRFIAEKLGICANLLFDSPESFLNRLIGGDRSGIFEREPLAWRIFETLKKIHAPEAGTPAKLRFGLEGKSEREFYRLAQELGDLFWRYQSFRPQMIRDWTFDAPPPQSAEPDFLREYERQRHLWKNLNFKDAFPPAVLWQNFLASALSPEAVPPRIFAFAPSALPKLHLELLEKLAESAEVFLYYHHLSHDLWTETADSKKRLRERLRGNAESANEFTAAAEGNELLTAWGKAARPLAAHFIDAGLLEADSSLDAPPERDSILHALQREIRDNAPVPARYVPEAEDSSLKISVAPSRMREMEILRDELIARFSADPELKPRDILVMFPALADYAPFVRAAFENSGIPFSLADRAGVELFPVVGAFLEILHVAAGEFRLDEVLALLEREPLRAALDLDESETAALRPALAAAGIRWGIDAGFREKRIFAGTESTETLRPQTELFSKNNSWESGLRRLAFAYMHGNAGNGGKSPDAEPTEQAPEVLGKMMRLFRLLTELGNIFSAGEIRAVGDWCDFLKTRFADELFAADADNAAVLRQALDEIRSAAGNGNSTGVPAACTLDTLCAELNSRDWGSSRLDNGMLRGKITFCQMQPLRNIPAKIICIAGLSDGAFPRPSDRSARDLLSFSAQNFPAGTAAWDRSRRDDDCLLFLENILAAEETLLLSYVGRDANDGQSVPPCVPLAKLRDFILQIVSEKNDTVGASAFETVHRLHGFSPEYFSSVPEKTPAKYFSFSRADYATLCAARSTVGQEARGGNVLPLPEIPEEISATELALFLKSPAEFLCKKIFCIAKNYTPPIFENDDPPETASALDVAKFHRSRFESSLNYKLQGICPPEFETAIKNFRQSEISAGRISALADNAVFDAALAQKIKDIEALESELPEKLFRVPEASIPFFLPAEKNILPPAFPALRIMLDFPALFCDEAGTLILPIAGRKRFDWRSAAECFVFAQMLAATFPQAPFRVFYFAYDEKKPHLITNESLSACGMSAQGLIAFYAQNLAAPPFLFEKTPLISPEKTTAEDFVSLAQAAWKQAEHDATELFVFGENADEALAENLRETAFPTVRAVCAAFV